MKKTLILLTLFGASLLAKSQSIQLNISPKNQKIIIGDSAAFSLKISTDNFNQQVFITLVNTDLPAGLTVKLPTGPVSSPFTNLNMKVQVGNVPLGTYNILVKAGNGPVESVDTLHLSIASDTCNWQVFTTNFTDNYLTSMLIDKNDNIFLGANHSFFRYKNGIWQEWSNLPLIKSLKQDDQNNIWMATSNGTIKYDGTNFTTYTTMNSNIPSNYISDLEFYNGSMWFATTAGIAQYDGTFWKIYNKSNSILSSDWAQVLKKDKKGKLWAAIADSVGPNGNGNSVLFTFDGTKWESVHGSFDCVPPGNSVLYNQITSLDFDASNNLWLTQYGYGVGLAKLSQKNLEYWSVGQEQAHYILDSTCKQISKDSSLITTNLSQKVFVTSNGDVWIAEGSSAFFSEHPGDLVRIDHSTGKWKIYNAENSTLPQDNVHSIAEDSKGNIWVTTDYALSMLTCSGNFPTAVTNNKVSYHTLALSPMPAKGTVRVQSPVPADGSTNISIIKTTGEVLYSQDFTANSQTIDQLININGIDPGIYIVKVATANSVSNGKLIVE